MVEKRGARGGGATRWGEDEGGGADAGKEEARVNDRGVDL